MVIGKGGETIRSINQQSGAHCEIDRSGPQDGPEKVFVIRGSRQQIEHAKELIMEKVNTLPPRVSAKKNVFKGRKAGKSSKASKEQKTCKVYKKGLLVNFVG